MVTLETNSKNDHAEERRRRRRSDTSKGTELGRPRRDSSLIDPDGGGTNGIDMATGRGRRLEMERIPSQRRFNLGGDLGLHRSSHHSSDQQLPRGRGSLRRQASERIIVSNCQKSDQQLARGRGSLRRQASERLMFQGSQEDPQAQQRDMWNVIMRMHCKSKVVKHEDDADKNDHKAELRKNRRQTLYRQGNGVALRQNNDRQTKYAECPRLHNSLSSLDFDADEVDATRIAGQIRLPKSLRSSSDHSGLRTDVKIQTTTRGSSNRNLFAGGDGTCCHNPYDSSHVGQSPSSIDFDLKTLTVDGKKQKTLYSPGGDTEAGDVSTAENESLSGSLLSFNESLQSLDLNRDLVVKDTKSRNLPNDCQLADRKDHSVSPRHSNRRNLLVGCNGENIGKQASFCLRRSRRAIKDPICLLDGTNDSKDLTEIENGIEQLCRQASRRKDLGANVETRDQLSSQQSIDIQRKLFAGDTNDMTYNEQCPRRPGSFSLRPRGRKKTGQCKNAVTQA